MIKRFLLWLARNEIADAVARERRECTLGSLLQAQANFLSGHNAGFEDALKEVEAAVRERMGGGVDLVTPEDYS